MGRMKMKYFLVVGIVVLVLSVFYFGFSEDGDSGDVLEDFGGVMREFDVVAKQWEFSPDLIEVNEGDRVVLNVKSVDVAHGIAFSDFGVNEYLSPGDEARIEFVADKKGEFDFFCNVYCGDGHGEMRGKLVVR